MQPIAIFLCVIAGFLFPIVCIVIMGFVQAQLYEHRRRAREDQTYHEIQLWERFVAATNRARENTEVEDHASGSR